jgi:RNA polymerase sigma-70 factor (sigma-E family)
MDAKSEEQFREFVRSRSTALLGTAYAITGHQQAAEDLLQNALAKTATHWRRVHTSPEAYVRRVMYNDRVSWWRRLRVREEHLDTVADVVDPADPLALATLRITLKEALRALPPRQRAVLALRYLEDRSEAETAQLLGVSQGTVASQVHRALAKLRANAPALAGALPAPAPTGCQADTADNHAESAPLTRAARQEALP